MQKLIIDQPVVPYYLFYLFFFAESMQTLHRDTKKNLQKTHIKFK